MSKPPQPEDVAAKRLYAVTFSSLFWWRWATKGSHGANRYERETDCENEEADILWAAYLFAS